VGVTSDEPSTGPLLTLNSVSIFQNAERFLDQPRMSAGLVDQVSRRDAFDGHERE
jgi:hypothetical protein